MEYIEKDFLAMINGSTSNPAIQAVREVMERYKLTLYRELPRAANKEIHVIGMMHHGKSALDDKELAKKVIISQQEVTKYLCTIDPDIVGVEGFCGEKYTVRNQIIEYEKLWHLKPIPYSEMNDKIFEIENDPMMNSIINFKRLRPHVFFCGVEQPALDRMHGVIMHWLSQQKFLKTDPVVKLHEATSRLRGLMMIAKLARHMKNFSKVRAALPVGYDHLKEIKELNGHLHAHWIFHDATVVNGIDLKP